jgi:transcriptional regulator with PAS, ATPase and Fis domain
MVNMTETAMLDMHALPEYLLRQSVSSTNRADQRIKQEGISLEQMIEDYEKEILQRMLDIESFSKDKAKMAQVLQISLSTLYRKLEKYHLG